METLDRLFGDTASQQKAPDPGASDEIARLREMVGSGPAAADGAADLETQTGKLRVIVGGAVSSDDKADLDTQTGRLRAIVGRAWTADAVPASDAEAPGGPRGPGAVKQRRSRGRRTMAQWLNGAVAIIAVAAVVAVVSAVVVQNASSTEVVQAAASLRTQEAELRNRTTTLQTSLALYDDAAAEAQAAADTAEAALLGLEGKSDEAARAAALEAVAVFRASLEGREAPSAPAAYEREPSTAADDLVTVAAQLDAVRAASDEVERAIDAARAARAQLGADEKEFLAAITVFGSTLPQTAAALVAENGEAGEQFRTAVTDAAAAVAAAQQRGSVAAPEMASYSAAVDALRADNERALAERAAQPVRRNRGWAPPRTTVPPVEEQAPPPVDEGTVPPADEPQPPVETPVDPVDPPPTG